MLKELLIAGDVFAIDGGIFRVESAGPNGIRAREGHRGDGETHTFSREYVEVNARGPIKRLTTPSRP